MNASMKMAILIKNQLQSIEDSKHFLNRDQDNHYIKDAIQLAVPAVELIFKDIVTLENFKVTTQPMFTEDGKMLFVHSYKTRTVIEGPVVFNIDLLTKMAPYFQSEFENWVKNYKACYWYVPFCAIHKVCDPNTSMERYGFMTRFRGINL